MYDAILVLGKSLINGELTDASKAVVQRAVQLFNQGKAKKVIFSGRWYYKLPPQSITEAKAMAQYAQSLGLPESAIVLETKSDSTVTNIYFCKTEILAKNHWTNILLVNLHPFAQRAMMTARKVLGSDYMVDLDLIKFKLPDPKYDEYVENEKKKIEVMSEFYKQFKNGDHNAIYQAHLDYLKNNS